MKSIIVSEIGKSFFTKYVIEQFDDVKVKIEKDGLISYVLPDGTVPECINSWQSIPDPVIEDGFVIMKSERPSGNYISNENGEWVIDKSVISIKNNFLKEEYLTEAINKISILQDAFHLNMQTDGDEDRLEEWKKYRILLSRVNATTSYEIEWPKKPQ